MRVALLQLDLVVGDLKGNAARIEEAARKAADRGAHLCLTSELALTGYPPRDLLLVRSFVDRVWHAAEELAKRLSGGPPLLLGLPASSRETVGKPLYNAAAFLHRGEIKAVFRKCLLPTYDVFDEDRYFEPGSCPGSIELMGRTIGVTICEDVWNDKSYWATPLYRTDPVERLIESGSDVIVNLSASPFSIGKQKRRLDMLGAMARSYSVPILYTNQVGGNDDLVFDGRSMAIGADGQMLALGRPFEEDVLLVDLAADTGDMAPDEMTPEAEAYQALVVGTRDYVRKCGFSKVLLGLSGCVDSSLTALIAARALGPENVLGVLMPSPHTSRESIDDALELARNLSIRTTTIPIADLMAGFNLALAEEFKGLSPDVTEENIQSRIRGNLLMAMSNKLGAMLLTTGNKSELAVGYCTIYGDMSGGLAVISDLPKTLVYSLCHWINVRQAEVIPPRVLIKAPTAELRPNQTDQDSLPPYDLLDAILHRHIELNMGSDEIEAQGFRGDVVRRVVRLVRLAEFKRRQAAPGIKITDRAFGTGWRMPIAGKFSL